MHIKNQPAFSPKLDMQSYPVSLKSGQCPQNIIISLLMMYLCKFGRNISTRCSDEMQISSFYRRWGILISFWLGKRGKVLPYELASVPIFQIYIFLEYQRDLL